MNYLKKQRKMKHNEEQRTRNELGEEEIRIQVSLNFKSFRRRFFNHQQENEDLQQREEEVSTHRDHQIERLESLRSNREIQRNNSVSDNEIGAVFASLFAFTLKAVVFVLAVKKSKGNLTSISHQHFRQTLPHLTGCFPPPSLFTSDMWKNVVSSPATFSTNNITLDFILRHGSDHMIYDNVLFRQHFS